MFQPNYTLNCLKIKKNIFFQIDLFLIMLQHEHIRIIGTRIAFFLS